MISISTSQTFNSWVVNYKYSIFAGQWRFYLSAYTIRKGLNFEWMFYSGGQATFKKATQTMIPRGTLEIDFYGRYEDLIQHYEVSLTNFKWHYDPWPVTVTSQPIRLSTSFMTLIPSLTFVELRVVSNPNIYNGCGMPTGNAYPSGHLFLSPFWGLAYAPIVETRFPELAVSLFDFSP